MTSPLAIQLRKEVRELLPWWAGVGGLGVLSVSAPSWLVYFERTSLLMFGLITFAAGTVALGANVFGHEFTNRTMEGLLSLPVRRSRLLALKLGVLLSLVAVLGGTLFTATLGFPFAEHLWRASGLVIAGLAVGVAPCLTLIFRSPLPGAAFAAATPVLLWLIGLWIPGWTASDVETFTKQGSLFVSGAGFVLTCILFQRLEAIDGPVSERGLPGWFKKTALTADTAPSAPARRHHPILLLVQKELRLQRMTMLFSAIFSAAWLFTVFSRFVDPQPVQLGVIYPFTAIHGVLVTVMAGAIAFADERQLGAWPAQSLLPMRSGVQTDVKVGVALALALLQALALPMLLNAVAPAPDAMEFDAEQIVGILAICVSALYVSSASASGIRAVLTMLPFTLLAMLVIGLIGFVMRVDGELFRAWNGVLPRIGWSWRTWMNVKEALSLALLTGLAIPMLGMAYRNHRTADRSHMRYAKQVVWLVIYALAAGTIYALVDAVADLSPTPVRSV